MYLLPDLGWESWRMVPEWSFSTCCAADRWQSKGANRACINSLFQMPVKLTGASHGVYLDRKFLTTSVNLIVQGFKTPNGESRFRVYGLWFRTSDRNLLWIFGTFPSSLSNLYRWARWGRCMMWTRSCPKPLGAKWPCPRVPSGCWSLDKCQLTRRWSPWCTLSLFIYP